MNSHRDNVKDVIVESLEIERSLRDLEENWSDDQIAEFAVELAESIFEALVITEDEQDQVGGHFLMHSGEKPEQKEMPKDEDGCIIDNERYKHTAVVTEGLCPKCSNQLEYTGKFEEEADTDGAFTVQGVECGCCEFQGELQTQRVFIGYSEEDGEEYAKGDRV